jgi:hypothetical protein
MRPGLYLVSSQERKFVATLDDILYGDDETQSDVCSDLMGVIREASTELIETEDEKTKIILVVVQ